MNIVDYEETRLVKRHGGNDADNSNKPARRLGGAGWRPVRDPATAPADCTGGTEVNNSSDGRYQRNNRGGRAKDTLELTGLTPYVVIAKFLRDRINANRPARCAFLTRTRGHSLMSITIALMGTLARYLRRMTTGDSCFDIHGTGRDTADIFLAPETARRTCRALTAATF